MPPDGDQGTDHGREALRRGPAQVWGAEPTGTLPLTLDPVIDADPVSSAAAGARSVLLIIDPGTPPAVVAAAGITQYQRRGADGGGSPAAACNSSPFGRFPKPRKACGETVTDTKDQSAQPLSFELDIRPLFRDKDRTSMLKAFDLWSFTDVVAHEDAILEQVRSGHMPCDGAWPADKVSLLADWIGQGSQP